MSDSVSSVCPGLETPGQVRGDPPPSRIEDSELEPAGTPRDAADAPEPDDARRRPGVTSSARQLSGQEPVAAQADNPVALDHLPAGHEHEREGPVGRGLVENPGVFVTTTSRSARAATSMQS